MSISLLILLSTFGCQKPEAKETKLKLGNMVCERSIAPGLKLGEIKSEISRIDKGDEYRFVVESLGKASFGSEEIARESQEIHVRKSVASQYKVDENRVAVSCKLQAQ